MQNFKQNHCRICLNQNTLTCIFEKQITTEKTLAEKLVYCAAIQVSPEDSLPSMICKNCEFYLNIAYTFKVVCVWVDSKLRDARVDKPLDLNALELYEQLQMECSQNQNYNYSVADVFKIVHNEKTNNFQSITIDHQNSSSSVVHNEVNSELIGDIINESMLPSEELYQQEESGLVTESKSLEKLEKGSGHNENFINCNSVLDDGVEEDTIVISTSELPIEIEDSLNFDYDYHQNFDDNKAVYRRVSLNSEDPLLLNVITKDLDVNEENNELKSICKEYKKPADVKPVNLNKILLHDFENFEKQQLSKVDNENHSVKSKSSSSASNVKPGVGRHIAKKNAGQPPKRYSPTLELTKCPFAHQIQQTNKDNSSITKSKCDNTDEHDENLQKKIENVSDVLHHEYIFEDDLSMPEPIFEETIITDSFYLTHDDDGDHNCDNEQNKSNNRKSEIKIKKKHPKEIYRKLKSGTINNNSLQRSLSKNKTKCNKRNRQKLVQSDTTCKICNKSFPFPSHLQRHLTAHIGIKRFTCKHCNKQFLHRYNLSVHMRSHTGNFPLHCNICNRGFASPSVLERHKRSHTGETPFQCRYCLQLFSHGSSLTMHEKMHLNRPSFTCEVCFKVFAYKSSLTAHKKGHSGFKPHSCNICHKKFTRKTSVMRHMVCHSEVKKCKCKICDQSFNSQNNLIKHRKIHKVAGR